ncbi:MAG: YihY family inner membrane protein [Chlorobiaceae bacterium]|nr:YihY family inner membrane protein [Chlorobiaceae bacterium]NTW75116.1 YihY family inner membrane protein [Chlorobiaceae bacterium]
MSERLKTSGSISGHLVRAGRGTAAQLSFMWRHLMQDGILLSAGSLAFQTLLSLVPMLAVVLATLKVFPVFASLKRYLADFLFQNFSPSQGAMLSAYLWAFIDKASTVPMAGGVFLFVIALFLISTIDHTLNGIWEVHAPRRIVQGFTLYWTVLTLGPLFIGSSLVASSFVWYEVFTDGALLEMKTRLLSFIPVLNSVVAFTLLYLLVPKRRVRFFHALAGGVMVAVLFELARKWFAFYVSNFATFDHIYGALSVVPMLFFWIYLEWVVVLTGAEFVYSFGFRNHLKEESGCTCDHMRGLPEIVIVLEHVWCGQTSGRFMNMKKLFAAENIPDRSKLSRIVDFLLQNEVIHLTADGGLALSADLHKLTLYDLYSKLPPEIVRTEDGVPDAGMGDRLEAVRQEVEVALRRGMSVPLVELLNESTIPDS